MSALALVAALEAEYMQVPQHEDDQSSLSHASHLPMPTAMVLEYQDENHMGPNKASLQLEENAEATFTKATGEVHRVGTWCASRLCERGYIGLSGVPAGWLGFRGRRRRRSCPCRLFFQGPASFEICSYFFSDTGKIELKLLKCSWSPSLITPSLAIENAVEPID